MIHPFRLTSERQETEGVNAHLALHICLHFRSRAFCVFLISNVETPIRTVSTTLRQRWYGRWAILEDGYRTAFVLSYSPTLRERRLGAQANVRTSEP